ncbi:hypothetical protein N0V93_002366 [Gnomoniopsis smithogilvyi]|uniref:Uncharacterized protein n=1 Tax=Gnomoniopsis smithogilvyi TaxID=1191159 RepID=A0A9W8YWC0_9PEZI|nr:hypothetical protein N0V93_002366 [Gnomoniopsis smithogilvyi]
MKFTLATIALFAGLAVALPAGNLNANQDAADAKNTNQKANANANAAANDGSGGVAAADKAEAAILLNDNGDAGAVQSGKAFTDAVDAIVKSGNKDEIAVLQGAGAIDKNNKPIEADAAAAN